ncbi:hypothetical protein [Parasaccharibacter apium]|uniref:hypothetical protein n=1 Tax=Parasaccharibacter apium TaxID=1510841 RepID=UPI0012EB80AA|nr:hypothetical protein [Parasaccharibacter apium]
MVREGFCSAIDGQATIAGKRPGVGVTGLCQDERAIQRAVAVSCEGPSGGIVAGDGQVLAIMGEGTADDASIECQGSVARIGDSTIRFVAPGEGHDAAVCCGGLGPARGAEGGIGSVRYGPCGCSGKGCLSTIAADVPDDAVIQGDGPRIGNEIGQSGSVRHQ